MTEPTLETLAERWRKGMEHAAETFARTHPTAYAELSEEVFLFYRARLGEFRRGMEALNRSAADAANYPAFALWLQQQDRAA